MGRMDDIKAEVARENAEDMVPGYGSTSAFIGLAAVMIELHTMFEGAFADEGTGTTGLTEEEAADRLIELLKIVGRHEASEGSR